MRIEKIFKHKLSMRKLICLAGLITLFTHTLFAQDEGVITKRSRIERDKGIFVAIGPSFTLGKNIGDYSTGFNIEAGFQKRMNRVFSVGPSLSYVKFKYDAEITKKDYKYGFVGGPYYDDNDNPYYQALFFDFKGGDISLLSLAANLKLNVIPIKDNSKFSFYGFAKPFVSYSTRTAVTGNALIRENVGDPNVSSDWYDADQFAWSPGSTYVKNTYDIDVSKDLKEESKVTGGIFVGPGIEFAPAKVISGFFQVAIGYTFPISYVSTEKYYVEGSENSLPNFITTGDIEKYPMLKKGFPSVSFQFGASYNF